MDQGLENYYLRRLGETFAGSESRIANLTIRVQQLELENQRLTEENEKYERTTQSLALHNFADVAADTQEVLKSSNDDTSDIGS